MKMLKLLSVVMLLALVGCNELSEETDANSQGGDDDAIELTISTREACELGESITLEATASTGDLQDVNWSKGLHQFHGQSVSIACEQFLSDSAVTVYAKDVNGDYHTVEFDPSSVQVNLPQALQSTSVAFSDTTCLAGETVEVSLDDAGYIDASQLSWFVDGEDIGSGQTQTLICGNLNLESDSPLMVMVTYYGLEVDSATLNLASAAAPDITGIAYDTSRWYATNVAYNEIPVRVQAEMAQEGDYTYEWSVRRWTDATPYFSGMGSEFVLDMSGLSLEELSVTGLWEVKFVVADSHGRTDQMTRTIGISGWRGPQITSATYSTPEHVLPSSILMDVYAIDDTLHGLEASMSWNGQVLDSGVGVSVSRDKCGMSPSDGRDCLHFPLSYDMVEGAGDVTIWRMDISVNETGPFKNNATREVSVEETWYQNEAPELTGSLYGTATNGAQLIGLPEDQMPLAPIEIRYSVDPTQWTDALTTASRAEWHWKLSDGREFSTDEPELLVTWDRPGPVHAELTGLDEQGLKSNTLTSHSVKLRPLVDVRVRTSVLEGHAPLDVQMEAHINEYKGNGSVVFTDWGDGTVEAGNFSEHTYVAPGTYEMAVWGENNDGYPSDVHSFTVTVLDGSDLGAVSGTITTDMPIHVSGAVPNIESVVYDNHYGWTMHGAQPITVPSMLYTHVGRHFEHGGDDRYFNTWDEGHYFRMHMEEGDWIVFDWADVDLMFDDGERTPVATLDCRQMDDLCGIEIQQTDYYILGIFLNRSEDNRAGRHARIQFVDRPLDFSQFYLPTWFAYYDPDRTFITHSDPDHPYYGEEMKGYSTSGTTLVAQPKPSDTRFSARSLSTRASAGHSGPVVIDPAEPKKTSRAGAKSLSRSGDSRSDQWIALRSEMMGGHEDFRSHLRAKARLAELEQSGEYEWVELNHSARPMVVEDSYREGTTPKCVVDGGCSNVIGDKMDINTGPQHHLEFSNAWDAWRVLDEQPVGYSPRVAVIDTGIWTQHESFAGVLDLSDSYDFVSDVSNNGKNVGINPDPTDPGNGEDILTSNYHGTHVAGLVVRQDNYLARSYNADIAVNEDIQFGIAPNVDLTSIRVIGQNTGDYYDIAQGILYAAGLSNASGQVPSRRADIINLSLGGTESSRFVEEAVHRARAAGVIVVAAMGNRGDVLRVYPASFPGVFSVGGLTPQGNTALFSSIGPMMDLVAVGGASGAPWYDRAWMAPNRGVFSADKGWNPETHSTPQTDYVSQKSGTSMAAPQVSAALSMMKSIYPDLTPGLAEALIAQGYLTQDLELEGWDLLTGHGGLDLHKAVQAAIALRDGELLPADLVPSVTAGDGEVVINRGTDYFLFRVEHNHGVKTYVQSVESSVPWLSISNIDVDGHGHGVREAVVNRDGLTRGTHHGEVTVSMSDGKVMTIPVQLNIKGGNSWGEVGSIYVMAIPVGSTTPALKTIAFQNKEGAFNYSLTGLEPGDYYIVASTDIDAEETYEITGEVHGRFVDEWGAALPVTVEPQMKREGVDFMVHADTFVDPNAP